jgi:hypothetical protein
MILGPSSLGIRGALACIHKAEIAAAMSSFAESLGSWRLVVRVLSTIVCLTVGLPIYMAFAHRSAASRPLPARAGLEVPSPTTTPIETEDASPATVRIALLVQPPTARVQLDGRPMSKGPILLDRSNRVRHLVVSASGFDSQRLSIIPSQDRSLSISLARHATRDKRPAEKQPTAKRLIHGTEL